MLVFLLIIAGIILYFITYKLLLSCYHYWQYQCKRYRWVKVLSEYIEAIILLLCLAAPTFVGFYGFMVCELDSLTDIGLILASEVAVSSFCLGLLIIYYTQKNTKSL
jgi:hypothetical protein